MNLKKSFPNLLVVISMLMENDFLFFDDQNKRVNKNSEFSFIISIENE